MMYCSGCGAEVPGELNYCNRCGMSLNAPATPPAPPMPPTSFTRLTLIIGMILIFGMMVVFAGTGSLMRHGIAEPAAFLLALLGMVTLFGTSIMLIRLWSKMSGVGAQQQPPHPAQPNRQQGVYEPPRAPQLSPRPANFGSVTENTTRTLDPVLRDSVEQK
jgi:hypothetical protein